MTETAIATARGWRHIERYAYVGRLYDDVWSWLAGHLTTLGDPLPDGGRSVELRIRPGGVEVSRPVRIHVGGLVCGDGRARAALGWADAALPRAFPQLEAVLEIAPVPHDGAPFTQLGVLARYRPPLGPLGVIGDRLLGAELLDASLTTFLDDLAAAVTQHVDPPAPALLPEPEQCEEPAVQLETRRLLIAVDGLAVRPGGASAACEALATVPGVVHVSLDPRTGLAAVDHDPARSNLEEMAAAVSPG